MQFRNFITYLFILLVRGLFEKFGGSEIGSEMMSRETQRQRFEVSMLDENYQRKGDSRNLFTSPKKRFNMLKLFFCDTPRNSVHIFTPLSLAIDEQHVETSVFGYGAMIRPESRVITAPGLHLAGRDALSVPVRNVETNRPIAC
jgi:hypothetical protein